MCDTELTVLCLHRTFSAAESSRYLFFFNSELLLLSMLLLIFDGKVLAPRGDFVLWGMRVLEGMWVYGREGLGRCGRFFSLLVI